MVEGAFWRQKAQGFLKNRVGRCLWSFLDKDPYVFSGHESGRINILLACFPKSGSTFASRVVSQHPDFERVHLVPSHGCREQELDIRLLHKHRKINYISQIHVKPSQETTLLIDKYSLMPIILTRNLYDVIPSFADHFTNINTANPFAVMTDYLLDLPDEQIYEVIADLIIPWYINFYVSWKKYPGRKLFVQYESLVKDPSNVFRKIFTHVGIQATDSQIEQYVEKTMGQKIKFNRGVSGRGVHIGDAAKNHVNKLCGYYPDIDFSDIGVKCS